MFTSSPTTNPTTILSEKLSQTAGFHSEPHGGVLEQGIKASVLSFSTMLMEINKVSTEGIQQHANIDPQVLQQWKDFQIEIINIQKEAIKWVWQESMGFGQEIRSLAQGMQNDFYLNAQKLEQLECNHVLMKQKLRRQDALLEMGCLDLSGLEGINDQFLEKIAATNPHLEQINLSGCTQVTGEGIQTLLTKCTKLVSLNVANCGPWPAQSSLIFNDCPQISAASMSAIVSCCPSLTNLVLCECVNLTDQLLDLILERCPHLGGLNLSGCSKITDEGLKGLINLKQLTHIVTPPSMTINGLQNVLTICRSHLVELWLGALNADISAATTLDLDDCVTLSAACIARLIGQCPKLTHLTVRNCLNFADEFCKIICENNLDLSSLTFIAAEGCVTLSDNFFAVIAKKCPKLSVLVINYSQVNPVITKEDIERIKTLCPNHNLQIW